MDQQRIREIRRRLSARSDELRADIQRELRKQDEERYSMLADRVSDTGEQSVADLLVDVDLAEISRDVDEFREIEAALLRIARNTYGICVDCEQPIEPERLERVPAASRCYACQQKADGASQREVHRTL